MLKNISIKVVLIALAFTEALSAQWVTQYDSTTKDLWAIQVLESDSGIGYCVGQNNFLVKKLITFGTKWIPLSLSSQPLYIYDLCFLTKDAGWIVGTGSTIYRTEDGGASWIRADSTFPSRNAVLRACERFRNRENTLDFVWVGGDNNILYRNEDKKGIVWHLANNGIIGTVRDIKFMDNSIGYCATTRGIFMTESGGSSWEKKSGGAIIALSFTSQGSGWAAGWFGTILYSPTPSDSGTWRNVCPQDYSKKNFYGIAAISDQEVYAVGDTGLVLHSPDVGATWEQVQLKTGESRNLRNVFALNNDHIWIVGERGANYYSLGEVKFTHRLMPEDTLWGGQTYMIEFSAPFSSRVHIDFQSRPGTAWDTIRQNYDIQSGLVVPWIVPDTVDSPQARLRIRSAVPGKDLSDEMTFPVFINDKEPPKIARIDLPPRTFKGQSLTVTATITDSLHDVSAILWYHKGGAAKFFDSIKMVQNATNNSQFKATIESSNVKLNGIEYYVEATDSSVYHNTSKSNAGYIEIYTDNEFFHVSPSTPGPNEIYQMVSIPLELDRKAISQVLEVEGVLGPYNKSKWRLFRWDPRANQGKGEYQEYKESLTETTFKPGLAFWLALADLDTLNTGSGCSVAPSDGVIELIGKGWHQVANPFFYKVFIADAQLDTLRLGNFNEWNPDTDIDTLRYAKRNILEPYKGYFVYSDTDTVMLAIPPVEATTLGKIIEKPQPPPDWKITLSVHSKNISGTTLTFGQSSNANDQFDRLDWLDPPPPYNQLLKSYIPHPEWPSFKGNYRADIRHLKDEGNFWGFNVESNIDGLVKLTFDLDPHIPAEAQVILLPHDTNLPYNLRERPYFQYLNSGAYCVEQFRLVVGSKEYIAEQSASLQPAQFVLSQNYPNPFNPTTMIRYALPVSAKVTLKIYNILGEEIAVLLDHEPKQAGYHLQVWNGLDKRGQPVPSGVYFYRINAGLFSATKKMLFVK